MKIQWLDEACTEAIVTRGWFRKRQAHVKLFGELLGRTWRFLPSRNEVRQDSWLAICLDSERHARTATPRPPRRPSDWQPVRALPPARVVGRKA